MLFDLGKDIADHPIREDIQPVEFIIGDNDMNVLNNEGVVVIYLHIFAGLHTRCALIWV